MAESEGRYGAVLAAYSLVPSCDQCVTMPQQIPTPPYQPQRSATRNRDCFHSSNARFTDSLQAESVNTFMPRAHVPG
jgi:hypothetical protein